MLPRRSLILAALAFCLPISVRAQELPKANKFEASDWYLVTYYRFKPGKAAEARDILYDHFIPTDRAAGREVANYDTRIGDWHHIAFFPMPEGAADLEWRVNPLGERFQAELAKKLGGARQATELMDKWNALIEETKTEVVMRRRP